MDNYITVTTSGKIVNGRNTNTKRITEDDLERDEDDGELKSFLLNGVAVGSVFVAQGLSDPSACGIFPDQGSNPCLPHWQADSLALSHWGSPLDILIMSI